MAGIRPMMSRQDHPLASVVALSVADDGTRRYDQVHLSQVIRGTELAPYLPREMWHAPRPPMDEDASRRSNVSSSTQSSVKEHTCPVCLDELREGCLVSRFSCSHVLHFECASSWLSSRICAGKSGPCPLWFAPPRSHLAPCRCWRFAVAAFEMPQEQTSRDCRIIASRGTRTWRKQLTSFYHDGVQQLCRVQASLRGTQTRLQTRLQQSGML
jgi:hypothetical protein